MPSEHEEDTRISSIEKVADLGVLSEESIPYHCSQPSLPKDLLKSALQLPHARTYSENKREMLQLELLHAGVNT